MYNFNYEYMTFLYVVHVYMFCNVVLYCIALPAKVLFAIKIILLLLLLLIVYRYWLLRNLKKKKKTSHRRTNNTIQKFYFKSCIYITINISSNELLTVIFKTQMDLEKRRPV